MMQVIVPIQGVAGVLGVLKVPCVERLPADFALQLDTLLDHIKEEEMGHA